MSNPPLVKSHKCPCGEEHKWDLYVMAHYNVPLFHTCPKCERKVQICRGIVTEIKAGRPM